MGGKIPPPLFFLDFLFSLRLQTTIMMVVVEDARAWEIGALLPIGCWFGAPPPLTCVNFFGWVLLGRWVVLMISSDFCQTTRDFLIRVHTGGAFVCECVATSPIFGYICVTLFYLMIIFEHFKVEIYNKELIDFRKNGNI